MIRKSAFLAALCLACALPAVAAEPDGLKLLPGFHAEVVASGLTGLRHMAVRDDHTIYASTRGGGRGGAPNPGIIVLELGPDHKAGKIEHFSAINGGTGIRIHGNWLYTSSNAAVYRFALKKGEAVPGAAPQTIVTGMPTNGFSNRILAFDGAGALYVSVGGSGNVCVDNPPKGSKPKGLHPCPGVTGRGGVWKFDANKANQKFPDDGQQIATGLRDSVSMDYRRGDAVYLFMHDRASTHDMFPETFSAADEETLAEELHRFAGKGVVNMGWPYTYYDSARKARLMAPEYGGDDKVGPPPGIYDKPVFTFNRSHSAPLDLLFYYGRQFPASYRGGAFVVRHGGTGPDLAEGHNGYDVVFIPFGGNGKPGTPVTFIDGFAGPTPAAKNAAKAAYRPGGVAVAPDGSLYVSDTQKGRIWHVWYDGK